MRFRSRRHRGGLRHKIRRAVRRVVRGHRRRRGVRPLRIGYRM